MSIDDSNSLANQFEDIIGDSNASNIVKGLSDLENYAPGGKYFVEATLENLQLMLDKVGWDVDAQIFIEAIADGKLDESDLAGLPELIISNPSAWGKLIFSEEL